MESLDGDATITSISPVEVGKTGALVFVDNKSFLPFLKENKPSAVVTNKEFISEIRSFGLETVFLTKNVAVAHGNSSKKYADRDLFTSEWGKRYVSAVIMNLQKVPDSCMIGPNAVVVGANVELGERTVFAGSIVESGAKPEDCDFSKRRYRV